MKDRHAGLSFVAPQNAADRVFLHMRRALCFLFAATMAASASAAGRRRAMVPTPRPACPLPAVALQLSRNNVCPGEAVTLSWQASDAKAAVTINGVGTNLPASGSTLVGTTSSLAYAARATNS
jgi:hypothetical protein